MFYLELRKMVDSLNSMSYDDEIPKQTEQEVGNRSFSLLRFRPRIVRTRRSV